MSYCGCCGAEQRPGSDFCHNCGNPVDTSDIASAVPVPISLGTVTIDTSLSLYRGEPRTFSFMGQTLSVSPAMDTFNYYYNAYGEMAATALHNLRTEYLHHTTCLDVFLRDFPTLYSFHRKPLVEAAMNVLMQAGIYDVSSQIFEELLSKNFCSCGADMDTIIHNFNATIRANQQRTINTYNMLPNIFFSGLEGFVAATAINMVMTNMVESEIRNANVSLPQRAAIFANINTDLLMNHAYSDYRGVSLTLVQELITHGENIWYPSKDRCQRANAIYQNLCASRVPEEQIPGVFLSLLQMMPYEGKYYQYATQKYGQSEEINRIFQYFDNKAIGE